jgi:hypothetical protein
VLKSAPKFNVLITTYEMIISDAKVLRSFKWKYLVSLWCYDFIDGAVKIFACCLSHHACSRAWM